MPSVRLVSMLFVLLVAAAPAGALRVEHFLGTLTVEIFPIPALTVSGEGLATLDEDGVPHVSLDLPASAVQGGAARVVVSQTSMGTWYGPANSLYPVAEVELSLRNGPAQLADGAGTMPLRGLYRACLWSACDAAIAKVAVPLTQGGTRGVGIGGTFTLPAQGPDAFMALTVVGAPWTTGSVTVTTYYGGTEQRRGSVLAPDGGTTFAAAARHGGVIEMVTPIAIYLGDQYGPTHRFGSIATFSAVFAPEPGTAVLLGMGSAALALAGRRRCRARQ
ncbi:MAG: hypothetical protein DCC71_18480 [Proteobacteria bacterium]|nr:MAG: hypothetical protein DCC71_18480 [Pseudomonadota bacterium]